MAARREAGDLAGGGLDRRSGLDLGVRVTEQMTHHPGTDAIDGAGTVQRPGLHPQIGHNIGFQTGQ